MGNLAVKQLLRQRRAIAALQNNRVDAVCRPS
jgi:ABC-type amino acid transport substrate-binding protein